MSSFHNINWTFHIIFMAFFFTSGFLFLYINRKSRRDFGALAKRLEMTFREVGDQDAVPLLHHFTLFSNDNPSCITQWVSGVYRNLDVKAFNYTHRNALGSYEDSELYQCIVFDLPLAVPYLLVKPGVAAADPFEGDRLYFDHRDFGEVYTAHGRHHAFSHDVLNADAAAWFVQHPHTWLELRGDQMLVARRDQFDAHQLPAFLDETIRLVENVRLALGHVDPSGVVD